MLSIVVAVVVFVVVAVVVVAIVVVVVVVVTALLLFDLCCGTNTDSNYHTIHCTCTVCLYLVV